VSYEKQINLKRYDDPHSAEMKRYGLNPSWSHVECNCSQLFEGIIISGDVFLISRHIRSEKLLPNVGSITLNSFENFRSHLLHSVTDPHRNEGV